MSRSRSWMAAMSARSRTTRRWCSSATACCAPGANGAAPVLLLDDLLSELDAERRTHLLAALARPDQQTLVTATGMEDFDAPFLERARKIRVEAGRLYPS